MKTLQRLMSVEEQITILQDVITNSKYNNQKLIDSITEEYMKHKLNTSVAYLMLQEGKEIKEFINTNTTIKLMKYIAFVTGIYKCYKEERFNPINFFKQEDLMTYDVFSNEEIVSDSIKLKHFIKKDEFHYIGSSPISEIAEWLENNKIFYNYDSQREAKYKTIGTTDLIKVKEWNIDWQKVDEIVESMLNGDYNSDTIVLNLRIIDNEYNQHQITKQQVIDDIYDLEIIPNYNLLNNRTTIVDILDGAHRIIAGSRANKKYKQETGEDLNLKLNIEFVILDVNDAKRFVRQLFKRSDTNKEWLDDIVDDDLNIVANYLINKSNVLKENVRATKNELKNLGGYTTRSIIREVLEKLELPLNNKSACQKITKDTAFILDNLIECIKDDLQYKSLDDLNKNTMFLSYYMFIPYIIIAYKLRKNEDLEILYYIASEIIDNKNYFIENNKEKNSSRIEKYINKVNLIIKEVCNNE